MKSLSTLFLLFTSIGTTYFFSATLWHRFKAKNSAAVSQEIRRKAFVQNGSDYVIQEEPNSESKLSDLVVYKKEGNNWGKVLVTGLDSSGNWTLSDWDKNGSMDIATNWKTTNYVYLFDSTKNEYVNTGRIGKTQYIEGGINYDYEKFNPTWMSTLYKIENFKKETIATMVTQTNSHQNIDAILIYDGEERYERLIETITEVCDSASLASFDYDAYWRKNWKRFTSK